MNLRPYKTMISKKKKLLMTGVLLLQTIMAWTAPVKGTSPNGAIQVHVDAGKDGISYTVFDKTKKLYTVNGLSVKINGKPLTEGGIKRTSKRTVSQTLNPAVPLKHSTIDSKYNELTLTLKNAIQLQIVIMDNAVAHRFIITSKGVTKIDGEQMRINPAIDVTCHLQQPRSFVTSYEEEYQHKTLTTWKSEESLATLPALLSGDGDRQLLIGESQVDDYPRLFLRGTPNGIEATFPKAPLKWEPSGDRGEKITQEASYIAQVNSPRPLPWRWIAITDSKGLVEQTIPVQLAGKQQIDDTSWIQPGQVSWEWWNGATPYGPDVNFKTGNNYETYKYYVDFASHYGVKYILLDEGWAQSTKDPFTPKKEMQLQKLISYAKDKGVGVILWLPWLAVEQHLDEVFKTYASWGIPAVKIDFMDHSDQWMVNYYKRVAKEAARHHMLVDFHGSFTPAGLEYEYPNVMSYEGVRGLEQMGGCRPDNYVYFPFMRNAVGPMDFTPGAMNNYQPNRYRADRPNSGAIGTRASQLACYVVFESGLQMLADNPTLYYRNDDCTRFITSVPTTWDETRCLAAEAGKYVVVAKRKGDKWFIGALNNGDSDRTVEVSLSFLGKGEKYRLNAFKDGVNADYQAMHYVRTSADVGSGSTIKIEMAKNGGWAASIVSAYAKTAEDMAQALIGHFWGASFPNYENRYFFNYGSDLSDMSTANYWVEAHAIDVITDAYHRTGNKAYTDLYQLWWEGMPRFHHSGNQKDPWWAEYVDDMEWIALAQIRMYEATGDTMYINKARQIYDDWIWTQWGPDNEEPWRGGITWKTDAAKSKNACSNGPAAIIAAKLYHLYDKAALHGGKSRKTYLDEAKQTYKWLRDNLWDKNTGAVYDNMDSKGNINHATFTYNSGTFIGAADWLYNLTGDKRYLAEACKAADFVIDHLSTNGGVPSDATHGDGGLFHGIFFRYLAQLTLDPAVEQAARTRYKEYLYRCAETLSTEGLNPSTNMYGGQWHKPAKGSVCLTPHLTGCMLMEAAAKVSRESNE